MTRERIRTPKYHGALDFLGFRATAAIDHDGSSWLSGKSLSNIFRCSREGPRLDKFLKDSLEALHRHNHRAGAISKPSGEAGFTPRNVGEAPKNGSVDGKNLVMARDLRWPQPIKNVDEVVILRRSFYPMGRGKPSALYSGEQAILMMSYWAFFAPACPLERHDNVSRVIACTAGCGLSSVLTSALLEAGAVEHDCVDKYLSELPQKYRPFFRRFHHAHTRAYGIRARPEVYTLVYRKINSELPEELRERRDERGQRYLHQQLSEEGERVATGIAVGMEFLLSVCNTAKDFFAAFKEKCVHDHLHQTSLPLDYKKAKPLPRQRIASRRKITQPDLPFS